MKDLLPEVLQFSIPFIFVLAIGLFAAALAYILYRQTNPQNSTYLRTFLATLRSILILLLVILFFKPKLFLQYYTDKPENIGLLIDHSASMGLKNDSENRPDSVNLALNRIENILADYDVILHKIYFNQSVLDSTDSIQAPFGTTNFYQAVNSFKKHTVDKAIMISDGIRTEGIIPGIIPVPVYTIGIGEKESQPDIYITDVEYSPAVYQNKDQRINIKISNNNMPRATARLFLYESNQLIASRNITVAESGTEQDFNFTFKPKNVGVHSLRAEIRSDTKDSNRQNNVYVFTQEVLKSKIQVGIFSSVPNPEHKFLKFLLGLTDNIETHSYLKIKNKLLTDYPTDSLDVVILQGYPGRSASLAEINSLKNSLIKNNPGILIMLDNDTDPAKMSTLGIGKIVSSLKRRNQVATATLNSPVLDNILLRVFDSIEQSSAFYNAVPPVESYYILNDLNPQTDVLLEAQINGTTEPILLSLENQNDKIVLFNGLGFWRWHFSLQRNEIVRKGYKNLLINLIRWAANKNKFKPVVLGVNKKSVNPGQKIIFDGHMVDALNNPIPGGQLTINATVDKQKFSFTMDMDSNGTYTATYTPVSEGTYRFEALGYTEGKLIGSDRQTVVVTPYNREFIHTNQDTSFLQLIAENSGGKYFKLADMDSIANYLNINNASIMVKEELELRFKSWLLYFILAIAILEWSLRKKNNLP